MLFRSFTDQLSTNEPLGYSASDVYNRNASYSQSGTTVTINTLESHGFSTGSIIKIGGFATAVTNGGRDYFNGVFTVTKIDVDSFSFTVGTSASISLTNVAADLGSYSILNSSYATIQDSAAVNMSYEIMTSATDVDLSDYMIVGSGDNNPFTFRGSEMRYVGEILENFSKNGVPSYLSTDVNKVVVSTRFDYFVECSYDPSTYTFLNKFKAWYIRKDVNTPSLNPTNTPELSALYGPSELGANNLIFEHPGNIASLSVTESAESASSRT